MTDLIDGAWPPGGAIRAQSRWIRTVLQTNRLHLHFQPVIRLADRQIVQYEALLRVQGPDGQCHPPGPFLAAADACGLMALVDRWVIRRGIATQAHGPGPPLFLNLSGPSFDDLSLIGFIEDTLAAHQVAPDRIGFEITESAAVGHLPRAAAWMRTLHARGCRFALDDFGVGYTSFTYLATLPIDQIKIDGSFIRTLLDAPHSRVITAAIAGLARSLGKDPIAESIETPAQHAAVREMQIPFAQGRLYAPPRPGLGPHHDG